MKRILLTGILITLFLDSSAVTRTGNLRIPLIASEKTIAASPDPDGVYLFTPAIIEGFDGRFIAAIDYGGPGTEILDGPRSSFGDYSSGNQIRVLISDNRGRHWKETSARIPMMHEILFKAGDRLYMLGHSRKLMICYSEDNGLTWSEPTVLRSDGKWHQSCGAVDIHNGMVTVAYEQWISEDHPWPGVGPVLMQAEENADLTDPSVWRFSALFNPDPDIVASKPSGIPALPVTADSPGSAGILETNVVRVHNPENPLYDPSGVVLMMRANTGFKDIGVMLAGRCDDDGNLSIGKIKRSGEEIFYTYIPGGHLKFHIQYDPETQLYWMVHSQINGRMAERRRLALSFSSDLQTWTLAGIVAVGPGDNSARNYATLMISGQDIFILSRSGDLTARNDHDGNITTFHRVKNFRKLVY